MHLSVPKKDYFDAFIGAQEVRKCFMVPKSYCVLVMP
jgi:hypothetical protein